ncbi:MBL fold metallo-hydrolase [Pseudonocardia sulfidoxydans NBRC 16205]|uniref:MBL fold metallo-hydrolase n=1 Tax=Pseudonocardia sulfidoxydans NBRC 16205 TaxID=1223511 RepID=A0A511DG26_9PSEU|nr:MBL fold metallo-hydrolase [Pseudonocardia sulfidoxydans]GEL23745.1 MBL fold metallo-hydrolase [Pseudonocardia sulfidoxydans NBRC 16205]
MSVQNHAQAPGFQRFRIGDLIVTALYDGYVPIAAADLNGVPQRVIRECLADAYLPEDGDAHTAVLAFLVEHGGERILVDTGSGTTLGPATGGLPESLRAADVSARSVDHVLVTHLHPDHAGGLVAPDGTAAFPRATVHVAAPEVAYWLDDGIRAHAEGVQAEIHRAAAASLAPYLDRGRLDAFTGPAVLPGVRALQQHGHTAGHTGYLVGTEGAAVLFWGDIVHSYRVQLPLPHVSVAIDNDPGRAVDARAEVLNAVATNGWWVGGAHLPFPGIGHLRAVGEGYTWLPAHFVPVPVGHGLSDERRVG